MDSQKDDVKIIVNKDEEKDAPKKAKKTTTKKRVVRRKKKTEAPREAPQSKKEEVKKETPKTIKKEETKNEKTKAIIKTSKISYALTVFVSVVVTAVIAGGGIYIWQQKKTEQSMFRVKQDTYSLKNDMENRLANLKNKLQGVEVENSELKNKYKDLETKASFLDGAIKKYDNSELGLSFTYPASFGEVQMTITKGVEGKIVKGEFTNNDKLIFGGVTEDYIKSSSSSDFLETSGFVAKKDKFYLKNALTDDEMENEVVPAEVLSDDAIIVNNNSFVAMTEEEPEASATEGGEAVLGEKVEVEDFGLGQNVGAIVNLDNDTYQGIAFINMDFGTLPFEDFKAMINGIEIK